MAMERRGPAVCSDSNKKEGKGGMIKIPISLQDLRRSLYVKAKAEATWRFWGLCVHVCKMETLQEAYRMAKDNDGAPGVDEVTFEAIEESGRESFLKQIQDELVHDKYQPMRVRKKENVRQPDTSSTQSEIGVSHGLVGVRKAARAIIPRIALPPFIRDKSRMR
jgi:retron-type reverse transcriptase